MKCDELKDKWFNAYPEIMGIEGGKPTKCYGKAEVDAAIAELKAKLEDVQATAYTESVDAGMENRKLKRALYKACANWARSERYTEATWHGDEHREELWAKVEVKCLKKAEEYK